MPARGLVRIVADLDDDPWGRLAGVLEAIVEEDTGKVSLKVRKQKKEVKKAKEAKQKRARRGEDSD